MTRISVVIPAYNAGKTIQECIESTLNNDYNNFEVIVVDDRSTDDTKEIIGRINDDRLRFFANETNCGASFTRNYGIKKSEGEIVLLLDADAYVKGDWIRKHAKLHEEISADIIGGGIIGIYDTIYGKCDGLSSWWMCMPYSKDYYVRKYHIPTNNMSVKRSVFEKIGYFNEDLETGEDVEFCFKALRNELRIYFKSDLVTYHYDRNDLRGFLEHQERWGRHTIKIRKGSNMDFSYLLPSSYLMAHIYILPLAILYTAFTIMKWVKYKPSVLFYSPIIFLGRIKQVAAIKDSFKDRIAES